MLNQFSGILAILALLLVSVCLQAQDQEDRSARISNSNTADVTSDVSSDVLALNGFSFASDARPMCRINGTQGRCLVEAFVSGEIKIDKASLTCRKLDRATYVGKCVQGKLDGLSLVIADGSKKRVKEAFLSYFIAGRMAYPALTSTLVGDANFGVLEKERSYGCVYFDRWDKSSDRCALFIRIYGKQLFTDVNAQKLRDGTFDLNLYRSKFLEFMQRKVDDPK